MVMYILQIVALISVLLSTIIVGGSIALKLLPKGIINNVTIKKLANDIVFFNLDVVKRSLATLMAFITLVIISGLVYYGTKAGIKETLSQYEDNYPIIILIRNLGIIFGYDKFNVKLLILCLLSTIIQYVILSSNRFKLLLRLPKGD